MKEYHKIPTVYKRDPDTNYKTLLIGQYATPEHEYLAENEWEWTEKVDGMNVRVTYYPPAAELPVEVVTFRGKTDKANLPKLLRARLPELFPTEKMREVLPDGGCLYGEGFGAGIQKGGKYGENQDFVLFDVKIADWWLERENVVDIATKLKILIVPLIATGTLSCMVAQVRAGFQSEWGDFKAEGIVARPTTTLFARNGNRIITKVKYKDFDNANTLPRPVVET